MQSNKKDTKKELRPIKISPLNHKMLMQLKLDLNVKTVNAVLSILLKPYEGNVESAYALAGMGSGK